MTITFKELHMLIENYQSAEEYIIAILTPKITNYLSISSDNIEEIKIVDPGMVVVNYEGIVTCLDIKRLWENIQ